MNTSRFFVLSFAILLLAGGFLPAPAEAATAPACLVAVLPASGKPLVGEDVILKAAPNERATVLWVSADSTSAQRDGVSAPPLGFLTDSFAEDANYAFRFTNSAGSASCSIQILVSGVTIDQSSLASAAGKPTLSGKAVGVDTVYVVARSQKSGSASFKSSAIKVRNGSWEAKVSKTLADGQYDVSVYGDKSLRGDVLATGVLSIGPGFLSAAPIPLLFGGTAHQGSSVPVAYVKLVNTGTATTSISGFNLTERGGAADAVIGFATSDDKGGSRATISAQFSDDEAFVPLAATLAPKQLRIFTIKAALGTNSSTIGKRLIIDVDSVETDAAVKGTFPMLGTTWTLAY